MLSPSGTVGSASGGAVWHNSEWLLMLVHNKIDSVSHCLSVSHLSYLQYLQSVLSWHQQGETQPASSWWSWCLGWWPSVKRNRFISETSTGSQCINERTENKKCSLQTWCRIIFSSSFSPVTPRCRTGQSLAHIYSCLPCHPATKPGTEDTHAANTHRKYTWLHKINFIHAHNIKSKMSNWKVNENLI